MSTHDPKRTVGAHYRRVDLAKAHNAVAANNKIWN
jgi:hypothetical protein